MDEPPFRVITNLRKSGKLSEAWNVGCPAVQENPQDMYLKGAFFWVCYDYLKEVQASVKKRATTNNGNFQPNHTELERINFLLDWIIWLNIPSGGFEYRSVLLLFQKNLEYMPKLVLLLFDHRESIFEDGDDQPYQGDKGESPSLMLNFARKLSKAWLESDDVRIIDITDLRIFLDQIRSRAKDEQNRIWLDYDEAKCLIAAGELIEARKFVLPVLRKKQSESWAWGALAATYRRESPEAAIALYSQGILHSHDDTFILSQLASLAGLLATDGCIEQASMCLKRAVNCYEANGWRIKPNIEKHTLADWYNSDVDSSPIEPFLQEKAANASKYLYDAIHTAHGLVINLHKSGKGLHLYLAPGEEISIPLRFWSSRGKPSLGDYLEVQLGEDGSEKAILCAKIIEPRQLQGVDTIRDTLRVTDKGFGFVGDTYVPEQMIPEDIHDKFVEILRYRSFDKKKGQYGWKALLIKIAE